MHAYSNFSSRGGEKSGLLDLAEGHVERVQESFKRAQDASQRKNGLDVQTGVLYYLVETAALKQKQTRYGTSVRPLLLKAFHHN